LEVRQAQEELATCFFEKPVRERLFSATSIHILDMFFLGLIRRAIHHRQS